ncbi:MAG: hypothetical protein HY023_08510, partial [Chloroflexi bacterium]|nr:hypothetical protein [Chloroflexota bacterium]
GGLTVWNRADGAILRRFTTADGLPGIFVRAVLVDDDGTVWAATDGGAARFDGQNWTTYNAADGLDNPDVTVIARLGSQLIAGTQYGPPGSGLYQFDGQAWTPVPDFPSAYPDEQPDQLSNNVTVVLSDNAGGEWVGTTNGLGLFDGNAWRRYSTADGLPDNLIISLLIGSDGNLLAGTARGLAQFDGQKFTAWPRGPSDETFGMLQDLQGRYWFSGSSGGGLWRFDPATSNWDVFTKEANNLPTDTMLGVAQDQAGNLYFGSNGGGLVRYDGASFTTWAVPNVPTWNEFGIVLPAPGGELWFVRLYDSQTDRFDPRTETWSPVTGLPEGCRPLALDDKGNLLGGGNGGLCIVRADGRQTHVTVEQGLPSNVVTVVAVAKDTAWIGTDNGVASYDDQAGLRVFNVENAGLAGNNVFAILAASDGSVWVGTDRGLSRLTPDGQWTHYTIGNPFGESLANVTDIAEDANNAIWVGTWNDAVYRFDGQAWQRFSPDGPAAQLPHSNVLSIAVAPDNSLWFGGYYSGATRFDGKEWRTFNVADGLIQPNVNDIFVDKDGTVWFATSGGVSRYKP